MQLSFSTYADPDYGILLPTALVLAALGTNEYTIRKFRPILTENEDYLRIRGEDHVERIFYSATGLLKLCDSIASPLSNALKQNLMQFLQTQNPSQSPSIPPQSQNIVTTHTPTGLRGNPIVPAIPQSVQPYQSASAGLDAYAPASTYRSHAPEVPPLPVSVPSPTTAEGHDPAEMIAERLAPHLIGRVASQISTRVEHALTRLEQRQNSELSQAELLLQQQQLSLEQFQVIQQSILAAQKAAIEGSQNVIGALPAPPEVNLFNSVQVEQPNVPADFWSKMMAAMQIRTWGELLMAVGGLIALGLSSFLVLSALMRPPQRVSVTPFPPPQPLPSNPAIPPQPLPQP